MLERKKRIIVENWRKMEVTTILKKLLTSIKTSEKLEKTKQPGSMLLDIFAG